MTDLRPAGIVPIEMAQTPDIFLTSGADVPLSELAEWVAGRLNQRVRRVFPAARWQRWLRGSVTGAERSSVGAITFGQGALEQVSLSAGRGVMGRAASIPIFHVPAIGELHTAARWMRALPDNASSRLVVFDASSDAKLGRLGVPPEKRVVLPVHSGRASGERAAIRESLGIAPEEQIVLACGPSHPESAHDLVLWAVGILHILDERCRVLITGNDWMTKRLQNFAEGTGSERLAVFAPALHTHEAVAVADLVCAVAPGEDYLHPVATAMAARKPIVATATVAHCHLLTSGHNSVLLAKAAPRLLGQEIQGLLQDSALAHRLAEGAGADAYRQCSPSDAWAAWQEMLEGARATAGWR